MDENASKFIITQSNKIGRECFDFIKKEQEVEAQVRGLAWDRRSLYFQCKRLLDAVKSNPELKDFEGFNTQDILSAEHFVHEYEKDQKENAVSKLLSWGTMSAKPGESFLLSETYDLIGKDDARTLRHLVREVVKMADPSFVGDI